MQGGRTLVQDYAQLSSVLLSPGRGYIQSLTKIIATIETKSRSEEIIGACLRAGISRDSRELAMRNSTKLCAIMMDTTGPELRVCNESGKPVELKADDFVTMTSDASKELSSEVVPLTHQIWLRNEKMVRKGDTIFLSQHLFTGHETMSVWLEVSEIKDDDVICQVKNSATLAGSMFTI